MCAKKVRIKPQKNGVDLTKNRDKLNETLKKQWVEKAIEMMKEGSSTTYIRQHIAENKQGSRSVQTIDNILSCANSIIVNSQFAKTEDLVPIHLKRYNNIIKKLLLVKDGDDLAEEDDDIDWEKYYKLREKKVRAYSDLLNTMYQKESLLQFHNKNVVFEFNTEEVVEVNEKRPKINIAKLSFQEQLELLELVKLSRKGQEVLLPVIQLNAVESENTVDVEHEVVSSSNISDVTVEELPEPLKRSPVTASDPTIKLRETLNKLAAQKFKEVGTLTDEENELIK